MEFTRNILENILLRTKSVRDNIMDPSPASVTWENLDIDTQKFIVNDFSEELQEKLLGEIFFVASFDILDILITPQRIDSPFEISISKALDIEVEYYDDDERFDTTRYTSYAAMFGVYQTPLYYAVKARRYDLIEYLLKRDAAINYKILSFMSNDDTIKIVIDMFNLSDEHSSCLILSSLKEIEQFEYYATKFSFMGYELQDYKKYRLKSPIEKFLAEGNFDVVQRLVELGIPIAPDGTQYLRKYKNIFRNAPDEFKELFQSQGGDITTIEPHNEIIYVFEVDRDMDLYQNMENEDVLRVYGNLVNVESEQFDIPIYKVLRSETSLVGKIESDGQISYISEEDKENEEEHEEDDDEDYEENDEDDY